MNAVFFVLVAILGYHAEGIKVRAIRRRLIEYPYESPRQIIPVPPQTEYTQRVPINEDPRIFSYLDRNGYRYNMYRPHTYGGNVNQNRRVMANAPNILWTKAAGPDLIHFGEGRSGQNEYNVDQNSREGIKEQINYSLETDTNSRYREISLNLTEQSSGNKDQTNNLLDGNNLNFTDNNQSNGTIDVSRSNDTSGSLTGEIEIGTDENLVDKVSGNEEQNNNPVSLLSTLSTALESEDDVNTVDQSKLNVDNVKNKPIRYVANKQYLLPPLSRRLYPVDEIKTDWENEIAQINMEDVNNIKEDNSGLIRLVPEREFISVDGGGKYFEDQSEANKAPLKNIVNVLDVSNNGNIAHVRIPFQNELVSPDNKNIYLLGLNNPGNKENVDQVKVAKEENSSPDRFALDNDQIYLVGENKLNLDKKNPLKGVVRVINVANPKNVAPIRLVVEDEVTSTDAKIKYSIDEESAENAQNENYAHDEKGERYSLPFYPYRFGQNTYLYQPTDQKIPLKQLNTSKLLQPAITRRVWHAEPNAEKNSDICLTCKTLLKVLSKNPNIITQYGLLSDSHDYEKNINISSDGISWNYLEGKGKQEPISLQYSEPSAMITKTVNENNLRMNTEKKLVDIYGYNKLEYPQTLSPIELTGDKLNLIIPKPQVNPQYDSMEDNKNFLLTLLADEPNVRLDETHVDASKLSGETQHVPDSKENSDNVTESTSKTPNSPVIYLTPILKTPHEVILPVSDELLAQNVPIESTVYELQPNDVPEILLKLKAPHASKIPIATVPDSEEPLMLVTVPITLSANSAVAAWDTVPEEEKDIPNAYTSTPNPWNTAPEEFLPSTPADAIDVSKTNVQFSTPQNAISQKLLPSETPDAPKMPVSYTSGPHVSKNIPDHYLMSSKAPNASQNLRTDDPDTRRSAHKFVKPTTYVQFATDRRYGNTRPKASTIKTSEETPDANDVSTAYASFVTDHNTIPKQLLPFEAFDVTETPTTNTIVEEITHVPRATDRKYENTVLKEMLPSNAPDANDVLTTHNLLTTEKDWSYYDPSNKMLTSEAPDASKTPSTPTPNTTKWKTTPEKTDANDVFTTHNPLATEKDWSYYDLPNELLISETPDASKTPTTNTPSTEEANMTDKSATSIRTPGTSKTPARPTTETNQWNNIPERLLPSTESDPSEIPTAYTLGPTGWNPIEEESVSSKTFDEFQIPVAIIYDWDTPEQLPTSPQPDTAEISTAKNQITTDWATITEEPAHSAEPDAFQIATTEIPNDWIKPQEILFSEDLDTSDVPTTHTPGPTDWVRIAGESVPSVETNVFKIPTNQIPNGWNKPENIDTSKVPTAHASVPTDWMSITGESVPSVKTSLPDYWNKPKQLLFSEEPGTFEVPKAYTSIPTDWDRETELTDELRVSKKPNAFTIPTTDERDNRYNNPERSQSYTRRLNTEYDKPILILFEGKTQEEQYYIRQVMNVLMPDLLRLYYSKCNEGVNEELLKRLKVAINSLQERNCETSQEHY